ncbi:MAG: DUF1934 domain-containing protein [Bacillota bacterium]|nr:DUF1934 domain-containing protein [Bacillota bacterium]
MNKEIYLQINSIIFQDGKEDVIEFSTEGKYYEKNNKKYFSYIEGKLTGMEGSTTLLIVEKNKLVINRYGSNKSKMVFILNEKTFTNYKTPYGNFEMEIVTNSLILKDNYIEVDYDLSIKGLSDGNNKLVIKIK